MILRNNKFVMLNFKQLLLIASSLGAISVNSISHAALFDCVSEPGFCIGEGDTVIFKYVGTDSTMGLYGDIQVIGDSIVSFPTDFRAESVDGAGTVPVSDNGTVEVIAKSGFQIDAINILERGDYLMTGENATVDVDGWASVADLNDIIFGPSVQQNLTITGDLTLIDSSIHTWTGTTSFDLASWDDADYVALTLQNNLSAYTKLDGETAWIEKKVAAGGIDLSVVTTVVPVPAAAWLFGSGLIGLIGIARRKKA